LAGVGEAGFGERARGVLVDAWGEARVAENEPKSD